MYKLLFYRIVFINPAFEKDLLKQILSKVAAFLA